MDFDFVMNYHAIAADCDDYGDDTNAYFNLASVTATTRHKDCYYD